MYACILVHIHTNTENADITKGRMLMSRHAYVCVRMHTCVRAHVHARIETESVQGTYVQTYFYTCTILTCVHHTYSCMHAYITYAIYSTHTLIHTCMHTYYTPFTHTHSYMHACIHTLFTIAHDHACIYTITHMYIHTLFTHIHRRKGSHHPMQTGY